MEIYVVKPGDSLYSIALAHGVSLTLLAIDNDLPDDAELAVGQTLVIQYPRQTHTVQPGESIFSIATSYRQTVRQVKRNNPTLHGSNAVFPGQTLIITYRLDAPKTAASSNGYAYTFINRSLLQSTLPYLTNLSPFTYGITRTGGLLELDDRQLIAMAKTGGTAPLMHLSTLTEEGGFSNELAALVLNDQAVQNNLVANVTSMLQAKGYIGIDVDFEFISAKDAGNYAAFIRRLSDTLHPLGYSVYTALAPKTSAAQPGLLYEGHDYRALGAAADGLLLMTYEWGYTYGPACSP
jgi:spore germination protein